MRPTSSSLDLKALQTSLGEALLAQFRSAASTLGEEMPSAVLREIVQQSLGASGLKDVRVRDDVAAPILEDEFEPHDYLHLVPQEIRRGLGQYMTPKPIAGYILRATGYRAEESVLEQTLCDPACGSGIFLVEAVR